MPSIRSILLALLSGFLYVVSFAPWDQGYLQWIAFVPLFLAVHQTIASKNQIKKQIFILGFIVSVCICLGGFYWIVYATQRYGGLPLFAALILMACFCVIGQLQVPLFLLIRHFSFKTDFIRSRPYLWIGISGLLYAGVESLYPKLFLDTAGHAFYKEAWFRQGADIGGPFFLTALIITVNEFFFQAIVCKRKKDAFIGAAIILASLFYGMYRVNAIQPLISTNRPADPKLRVSMIQANIGDFLKVQAERGVENASKQVIDQYLKYSREAMNLPEKPDAILWPETAYPALFEKPFSIPEINMELTVKTFAKEFGRPFLFGGYDQDQTGTDYNSLFFYNGLKDQKQVYHKAILLMFGETLPFAETFPSMKTWFPTMGFFGRGIGPQVFEVKNSNGFPFLLAPSICYEGLFTSHAVAGAQLSADAFVNITNDSWFGPKGEPYLHLALTIFRTIETRVPMIRSTNTGFTTYIDATGELVQSTHLMTPEVLTIDVPKRSNYGSIYLSMSQIFGLDWFVRFCQLVTVGLIIFLIRKLRPNPKSSDLVQPAE